MKNRMTIYKALDGTKSDLNYFFKYAKKFSQTATEVGPLLNANSVLVNYKRSVTPVQGRITASISNTSRQIVIHIGFLFYSYYFELEQPSI